MTHRFALSLTLFVVAAGFVQTAGAASLGTTGGQLLITASTARSSALGDAGELLAEDPGAVLRNPAGIAKLKRPVGTFTHQMGIAQDYSETLNVAFPLEAGVVGVGLVYHGMDALDDAGGDEPSVTARDLLGMVSFARREDRLLEGLAYGLNLKFLNSALGEYSANAVAADLGATWQALPPLVLGLSVRNLGTPMKFIDEADPLPVYYTLSGKYDLLASELENFFVVLSAEESSEWVTSLRVGGEFGYAKVFFLRLGYAYSQEGSEGISFGVGVQTAVSGSMLRFDYAYKAMPMGGDLLNSMQFITLGLMY